MTDADVIAAWLASKQPSTVRVYEPVATEFATWVAKPLADVTTTDTQRWMTRWVDQEAATQARKLRTLRSLYRYGQAVAQWPHNPFFSVRDPYIPERLDQRIPTTDEIFTLIEAAEVTSPRMGAVVTFIYGTAARISEVCSATWGDIARTAEGQWVWYVAGRKSANNIRLHPEVVAALASWRTVQGLPRFWSSEDTTPVFPNTHGEHSHPVTLTVMIRNIALKAGLPRAISAYGLRHAHAGIAIKRGVRITEVQRTLGHRRVKSTERYLTAVAPPMSSVDVLPWGKGS